MFWTNTTRDCYSSWHRAETPEGVLSSRDGGVIISSGRRVVAGSGAGPRAASAHRPQNHRAPPRAAPAGRPRRFATTTRRQAKASRHCWIASPLPTG